MRARAEGSANRLVSPGDSRPSPGEADGSLHLHLEGERRGTDTPAGQATEKAAARQGCEF